MVGKGKVSNNKRKLKTITNKHIVDNDSEFDLPKRRFKMSDIECKDKRLVVVLEGAQLETIKVGNKFELLNCDDHISTIKKISRDPGLCRPDITHQCLLMLFDSPLNRAGLLQVYLRTERNVLIEINPQTRIPRTFKRFAGLMVQLLHKFSIRDNDGTIKLMKVIKNPIWKHLPVGCKKYGMSFSGKLITNLRDLMPISLKCTNVSTGGINEPIVLVVGAYAHGMLKCDYIEGLYSISNYPLSAALTCSKICNAFETEWGIF